MHLLNFIDFSATWTWYTQSHTTGSCSVMCSGADSHPHHREADVKATSDYCRVHWKGGQERRQAHWFWGPKHVMLIDVAWKQLVKSALQIRACWGNSTSLSIQLLTECLSDEAPVWSTSRHKSRHPNICSPPCLGSFAWKRALGFRNLVKFQEPLTEIEMWCDMWSPQSFWKLPMQVLATLIVNKIRGIVDCCFLVNKGDDRYMR